MRHVLALLVLPLLSLLPHTASGQATVPSGLLRPALEQEGWIFIADFGGRRHYVHPEVKPVKRLFGSDVIEVTDLQVPIGLADERAELIAERKSYGLSTRGYEHWLYTMASWEIDCRGRRVSISATADFNSDDQILVEQSYDRAWLDLPEQTSASPIHNLVQWACSAQ